LEAEQTKEINFRYLIRDYGLNTSNNKFKFEAFQLPFDFRVKGKNPKDVLKLCKNIEKGKILYQTASLMVYLNYANSGLNSSLKSNALYTNSMRDERNNNSNNKMPK
jgi:hypothetical protein